MPNNTPLTVEVKGGELRIRIGTSTLRTAAEGSPEFAPAEDHKGPPYVKVESDAVLASEVCRELQREEEDGTTPLHLLFDEMFRAVYDDGGMAFEEESDAK